MRILLVSHFFYPEPNSPRGLEFAKELVEKGHKVICITGFPNYPDGEIYNGYKQKVYSREKISGIDVIRLPLYINHSKSAMKRFLSYSSFMFSIVFLLPFLVREKFDILFSYCPPITVPLGCIFLKWFYSSKLVVDIQDFWPDTLKSAGGISENSFIYKTIKKLAYFSYRKADYLSVISPGFKKKLISEGFEENKISVIYNWSTAVENINRSKQKKYALKKELGFDDNFILLFAGNVGKAQSLDHVMYVMKDIQVDYPKIQFYMYGAGVEKENLKVICTEEKITNVHFRDRVSLEEINSIQFAADTLFLHLKDDPLFEVTIPSKLSGYLMVGKPVIGGLKGDAKNFLIESNAGYTYTPENKEELKQALIKMYQNTEEQREQLAAQGKFYYLKNVSKVVGVQRFINIFNKI